MVGGVAVCLASASAQSGQPSGISARIGLFLPSNKAAEDEGTTWLSFGLDYRFNQSNAPAMVMRNGTGTFYSLSVDYYDKGGYRNIPIAVNYNVRAQQLIFTAGAGGCIETAADHETIGLGFQIAVTYEFTGSAQTIGQMNQKPFFLQAKYFLASDSALDGLGVYVGMRF